MRLELDFTPNPGGQLAPEQILGRDPLIAQMWSILEGRSIYMNDLRRIGKTQIMRFLAEARRQQGEKFDLQAFHDFLWLNGNVPISLQRWEYLGLTDDLETLKAMQP